MIWATGYRSDHCWIGAGVRRRRQLRHRRGVTDIPGLYFLGLSWQHTRGSALLGWVGEDAEFIAGQIGAAAAVADRDFHGAATQTATAATRGPDDEEHAHQHRTQTDEHFSTDIAGLPEAAGTEVIDLADGDRVDLRIAPVTKRIGDTNCGCSPTTGRFPANASSLRRVEVEVDVFNEGDLEATVHWHGLRLDNRYDGTHETQAPIPVGGRFSYHIEFPDPGVYWYHPHIREDYGQELGLYGNILVVPDDPEYWPPAHRELVLTLDDVLIEDGKVAPFSRCETNYAAMGRFGNVILVGGETDLALSAQRGEVVRFYLTNTANTRVFNVALPGARMKLSAGTAVALSTKSSSNRWYSHRPSAS